MLLPKNCNAILIERLQKKSTLLSGEINKYEYLTKKEILPSDKCFKIRKISTKIKRRNFSKRSRKY